jgi:threonine synthase
VFDVTGRDPARLRALWASLDEDGGFDLRGTAEWERVQAAGFASGRSSHADRLETIREMHARYGITIDPHTADGVKVGRALAPPGVPLICVETALPVKFAATIREALGHDPARPAAYEGLESRPQRRTVLPVDAGQVKAYIAQHAIG